MHKHRRMMKRVGRWALFACAMAAGAQLGCDNSCYSDLTCPSYVALGGSAPTSSGGAGGAGGTEIVCPDDPMDGPVDPSCGIWVSESLGDDANPGTQTAPARTLAAAVALAEQGPRRIYACGETYAEAVALPAGTSLFGGFDCQHGWAYSHANARRASIAPPLPAVALRLLPGDGTSAIRDVNVTAQDAKAPGDSSIAVFALPDSMADIRRATLTAGKGADGMDGLDGKQNGEPAKKGLTGLDGADACTMEPGVGGASLFLECDDGTSTMAGQGGDGGEQFANSGSEGLQGPNQNPQGFGEGGEGEGVGGVPFCTGGIAGAQGADGEGGHGSDSYGRLTLQGYIGAAGEDGTPGFPGQGGGGGGGSRGNLTCGGAPHGGAGGGAGGTGGCGGRAGKGGQAGGSSFGVASLSEGISLTSVIIYTGDGGNGGNGGVLQPGGQAGLPGLGGDGLGGGDPIKAGCAGGAGGHGGNGGNGAGGHGGHSAGFAFTSEHLPDHIDVPAYTGMPGDPGLGGDPNATFAVGQPGIHGDSVPLAP